MGRKNRWDNLGKGLLVEELCRLEYHGSSSKDRSYDFYTDTGLYEVKSTQLFVRSKFKRPGNRKSPSHQVGRFMVSVQNHYELKRLADLENKTAKYIFVVRLPTSQLKFERTWSFVDGLIDKLPSNSSDVALRIFDVVYEGGL